MPSDESINSMMGDLGSHDGAPSEVGATQQGVVEEPNQIAREAAERINELACDEARATIAQLRKELEEANFRVGLMRGAYETAISDVATAQAQVAALQADKDRMDWLLLPENTIMRIIDEVSDDWIVDREQIDTARIEPTQEGA